MKKIFTIVSALAFVLSFASCQKDSSSDGPGDDEEIIELDVPSGLKLAEYGDESIKMAWEPVNKAEYYTYKVIAKVIENEQAVDSVVLMGKTFNTYKTIVKLDSICVKNGYNYWFTVAAGAGKRSASEYSEYVRCEPGGLTPLVPGGVTMTQFTDNGLTYKWEAAEEAEYYSYQLTNPKGEVIKKGDTRDLTVTLDGLKKGRYYYFAVAGANPNKTSAFSKKVEGLTFGEYIPALTFTASWDDENFSFAEGTELTITDGTYTAGYIVKSSGKTTTLELTTEEEVQYNQPKYTALIPNALNELGNVAARVNVAEDGTFTGVPGWAETDGTNMVFHSFYSVLSLNVSSKKSSDIDKVILRSDRSLSGKLVNVVPGSNPSIDFAGSDGQIDLVLPNPVKITSTPTTLKTIVPIGTNTNLCAIFENEGLIISGKLTGTDIVKEKQMLSSDISFMIVEEVEYSSVCAKLADPSNPELNTLSGYATIGTGDVTDYDYGFLVTPFMEHDWSKAAFIPAELVQKSGSTFVFRASLSNIGTAFVRACVKPKGLPLAAASVGTECFCFDLDFAKDDLITPATQAMSDVVGVTAFGDEFPTTKVAAPNGSTLAQHLYSVNTFPISFGTGKQSGDRAYGLWWDKANSVLGSYKLRAMIYANKCLSGFKVKYAYWLATASKKYFIGNSNSAGSQWGATAAYLEKEEYDPTPTIVTTKTIYLGCDSNGDMSRRIFILFVK